MNDSKFDPNAPTLDIEFFRRGGNRLSESELEILGDMEGLRVLVSPSGTGEEVLSLLNMQVDVTVMGWDYVQLREASAELQARARFTDGSLGEGLPSVVKSNPFDILYSPWGSLDGKADLRDWAQDAADCISSGGRLIVYDEHPMSFMVSAERGSLVIEKPYWGEFIDEKGDGVADSTEYGPTTFGWAFGDLISALGEFGLATVRLDEFPESDRFVAALDLIEGISESTRGLVPAAFLLVAVKI